MFKKLSLCLLVTTQCLGLNLSNQDAFILETFFRTMLQDSEAGYVLYGKKPICIHGFRVEDTFIYENEPHKIGIYLREGALKWKSLPVNSPSENNIIHVYNHRDTLARNYRHILFINKKLFLETVEQNLPLFQYVLGPDITPSKLLEHLTDPEKSFHSVLKNDKVLIGIILGFGTENSLYVSRIENLEDSLFSSEKVPYRGPLSYLAAGRPAFEQMLLLNDGSSLECMDMTPSFGYHSLKEEIEGLCQKIDIPSQKLVRESPAFIFGRLKNHKKTDLFVEELEVAQEKIQSLLASSTFLKDVLHLITPDEPIHIISQASHQPDLALSNPPLAYLVAANIWETIEDEDPIFWHAFIEGMKNTEKSKSSVDPFKYQKLKAFLKVQTNLNAAKERFRTLALDSDFYASLPHLLYYKTVQSGSGIPLEKHSAVTAHYTIETPEGRVLADTWKTGKPESIDLSKAISGFAWGMKGMKIGEIREIYMHPRLAYGIFTPLEKGIYLKALVQLVGIDEKEREEFPPLTLINIDPHIPADLSLEFQKEAKAIGYARGVEIWNHYKKAKHYSLEEVLKWIEHFQSGISVDISSEEAQNIISQLHWEIYQKG